MTRETISPYAVALLATGDEIRNGDILNTNSQEIALRLFNNGMQLGMHMVTGDSIAEIETAIQFLLQSHRALIITGGLGPTSDDLTRYALSNALQQELVFDDVTWNNIVDRLKSLGYETPPQTNRQQALFPIGATIIPNSNGTASGCMIQQNNQFIFMLPGPPTECLPLFDQVVIKKLMTNGFQKILFHRKWLLFGVSEGQIAEELDELAKSYDCITGYRLWYPYIEFKIYSNNPDDFNALIPKIEKTVAPFVINDGKQSASETLKHTLLSHNFSVNICDLATGGLLESILKTPQTKSHLYFSYDLQETRPGVNVQINGLEEFWQEKDSPKTSLEIIFLHNNIQNQIKKEIPLRGLRVKQYAVEFICKYIYENL